MNINFNQLRRSFHDGYIIDNYRRDEISKLIQEEIKAFNEKNNSHKVHFFDLGEHKREIPRDVDGFHLNKNGENMLTDTLVNWINQNKNINTKINLKREK